MKRRNLYIIGAVGGILVAALAIYYVLTSNLLLTTASVTFSPGENDLNKREFVAPYGWYYLDYEKTQTKFDSSDLHVVGIGRFETGLFGPNVGFANYYPDHGTVQIPFDEPTLVYQSEDKSLELYIIITKNPDKYEYLKSQ